MANKFYGEVGYAINQEVPADSGIWKDVITERKYYGDILQMNRKLAEGDKVNEDITLTNSISIVADAFAHENFFAIRYIKVAGVLWVVNTVEIKSPRLILRMGGKYDGPTPAAPPDPEGD